MNIIYKFSMPNHLTFKMKPVKEFIQKDGFFIDPFSNRKHEFADLHNDIDKSTNVDFHMCALEFLKSFDDESVDGVLFDPPYSLTQLKEVYSNIGFALTQSHVTTFFRDIKNEISRIVKKGGSVYSFGWSSVGMGKNRGFEKTNLLILTHGGYHNDTLCLEERKV